jgi:hypothetical protein
MRDPMLKAGAVWLTVLFLTTAGAAPASASLAYPDHQLLLYAAANPAVRSRKVETHA